MPIVMMHTGGWNREGTDIDSITFERLVRAYQIWKTSYFLERPRVQILVTAGTRNPVSKEPICASAKRWLMRYGMPQEDILLPDNPRVDNTIAEVIEAVKFLKENSRDGEPLAVVSSWWHVNPRVRIIWGKYRNGINPTFHTVEPRWDGARRHLRELVGTLAVLRSVTGPRFTT